MRASLTLCLVTLLSLACGGAGSPVDSAATTAPEAAPEPTDAPASADEDEPDKAKPVALSWLEPVDGRCVWRMGVMPGGAVRDLVSLPWTTCPDSPVFAFGPEDRTVLVNGGAELPVLRVDLAAKTTLALPDPRMELVRFDAAGRVIGCTWTDGETQADGLHVGDRVLPFEAEDWQAGVGLATAWHLDGTAWVVLGEDVYGLPEGVGPPFCDAAPSLPAREGREEDPRGNNGGHGNFADTVEVTGIECDDCAFVSPVDDWHVAVNSVWLEGTSYQEPVVLMVDDTWRALPSVGGSPSFSIAEDRLLVTGTHSALYDLNDGALMWEGPTAFFAFDGLGGAAAP